MALIQPRLHAVDGRAGAIHNGHAWDKVRDGLYWGLNQRPRPVNEGKSQLQLHRPCQYQTIEVENPASGVPEVMHQKSKDALCLPDTVTVPNMGPTEGPLRRATKRHKVKRQSRRRQPPIKPHARQHRTSVQSRQEHSNRPTIPGLEPTTLGREPGTCPTQGTGRIHVRRERSSNLYSVTGSVHETSNF